jgi:phage shock protein PspC (stress-responsive transcriptional regulator)/predicted membrane protein
MAAAVRPRHDGVMSEHISSQPFVKRLERSSTDRTVAGVCGGLGRYFDMTPAVFRLGFVVLTLLGGAGVLVYIAAVLIMPGEGKTASIAEEVVAERRDHPGRLVALGLVAVALLAVLSRASTWPLAGAGWIFLLIVGLMILWATRERRAHRIVVAVVSLITVGLVATIVAVSVAFGWFNVSLTDGVGKQTYVPTTVHEVRGSYHLGIGELRVDLSQLPASASLRVKAHVGIGKLRVIVPRNANVVVDAKAKAGDVRAFGRHANGHDATVHTGTNGTLYLDAEVGAGRIDVVRAS